MVLKKYRRVHALVVVVYLMMDGYLNTPRVHKFLSILVFTCMQPFIVRWMKPNPAQHPTVLCKYRWGSVLLKDWVHDDLYPSFSRKKMSAP